MNRIIIFATGPLRSWYCGSELAGKPLLAHTLDNLSALENTEFTVITESVELRKRLSGYKVNWIEPVDSTTLGSIIKITQKNQGVEEQLVFIDGGALVACDTVENLIKLSSKYNVSYYAYAQKAGDNIGNSITLPAVLCIQSENMVNDFTPLLPVDDNPVLDYIIKNIKNVHSFVNKDINASDTTYYVLDQTSLYIQERIIIESRIHQFMQMGVRIRDPKRFDLRGILSCGNRVEIDINVIIEGNVILHDNVFIGANCIIRDSEIGEGTYLKPYSLVENSKIGSKSFIGPYGRVRNESDIGNNVQIGNYVELKNSRVGDGSRINHMTFIGDTYIGKNVTIGAGTITCNHDGVGIQETYICDDAYIGSGSILIAPVSIGANATIGAGSSITLDAPPEKLTLARSRQLTIDNWGKKRKKD